jgi:hypothetical protein
MARGSGHGCCRGPGRGGATGPRRSRCAERRSKAAAVLRRQWRLRGLGLGFRWVGAALCRAAGPPWRAGPGRGDRRKFREGIARWGGRRRGGRRSLTGGTALPERGRGRAGSGWAAEGKREREARGWGELGRGAAHVGKGGEGGPRERGRGVLGWATALPSFLFFFPFSFYTLTIQTNLVEFK